MPSIRSIFIAMVIFFAAQLCPGFAFATSSDYKSDLELDIEENGDDPSSQFETAAGAARKQSSSPQVDVGDIESSTDLAQSHLDRKLYDQAIQVLKPKIDVLPRSGLLLLAKAYEGKRDSMNELKTLELCIAKNPKDFVVKTQYGKALIRAKRAEEGLTALSEARKLNPRYRPAYDALLKELEATGERFEARNVIEDMRKTFGDQPILFTTLCRLFAKDAFHEKTIETCQIAIEKSPSVADNHVYLGIALLEREQIERSQKVLSKASRQFPSSESVHWALGELAVAKKDTVTAYNHFRKATMADQKAVRSWVGYGAAAFKLQKNDEALDAFIKACKLDKQATREFRSAIGELRFRKDTSWQMRFEAGINTCQ